MQGSIIDVQKIRNELKSERKLVFANFSKTPSNTRLALEIKVLDDRIWVWRSRNSATAMAVTVSQLSG